ncbi:MAG TPA: oligosaccharide flippase family protein [Longimicrobiales bacterium]
MSNSPSATPAAETAPTLETIARKAFRGALAVGGRQAVVQGCNILGGILLARLLSPPEYGIYAVFVFLLAFLAAFGDVGLGASLIRQEAEPSVADYRAIFTAQQVLVVAVVAVVWLVAPAVAQAYGRPGDEAWLFRIVGLSVIFTSLQTIAAIQLERDLAFGKLAAIEIAQALVFNGLAVALAWRGAGAASIAWALLARAVAGALLVNLVRPWRIGLRRDWPRVRAHLRFGLPYQGTAFISLVKDSITPVFIGLLLGPLEVGYVNWATMVAAYPVLALMVLQRVYFPAFSRLRSDPAGLGRLVEEVVRATNSVAAPLAALTLALMVPITRIVFGEQWLPALPYFYFLWGANLFVPTATPMLGLLNALGESRTTLMFAGVWMLGTWLVGAPLVLAFGAIGYAAANLAVQFTNLALFRSAQSRIAFRIFAPARAAWWAAALAGVVVHLLARVEPPTAIHGLIGYGAGGLALYVAALYLFDPRGVRRAVSWIRSETWGLASRPS